MQSVPPPLFSRSPSPPHPTTLPTPPPVHSLPVPFTLSISSPPMSLVFSHSLYVIHTCVYTDTDLHKHVDLPVYIHIYVYISGFLFVHICVYSVYVCAYPYSNSGIYMYCCWFFLQGMEEMKGWGGWDRWCLGRKNGGVGGWAYWKEGTFSLLFPF